MRQFGNLMTQLQDGQNAPIRHTNPYLLKVQEFKGILLSPKEACTLPNLDDNSDLIIEIGCYLGKTLCELAQNNLEKRFIGLDITYKRAVITATKIKKHNLNNARVALCEASLFMDALPNAKLNGVCIFFPDPWEKRKQKKNRLITESFCSLIFTKLKSGGFIWFKTDHQEYFEEANTHFRNAGFYVNLIDNQPNDIEGGPYTTAFESLFISKKISYFNCLVYKP